MLTATSFVTVLLTVGFFVLSNAMIGPSVASLISKQAAGGQGMAMGLNNAFMSLGRIVGPVLTGALLDAHLSLPYLSGGLIFGIAFLVSMFKLRPLQPARPDGRPTEAASIKPAPAAE